MILMVLTFLGPHLSRYVRGGPEKVGTSRINGHPIFLKPPGVVLVKNITDLLALSWPQEVGLHTD